MPIHKATSRTKPQNKKKKYQFGGILRGVRDRFGGGSNVSDDFINKLLEGGAQSPEALQALRRRGLGNRADVPGRFERPVVIPAQKAREARTATKVASHGGLVSRGNGIARTKKGKKYV